MENDPLDLFSVMCFAQFLPDIGKSLLLFPSANLGLKEKKIKHLYCLLTAWFSFSTICNAFLLLDVH